MKADRHPRAGMISRAAARFRNLAGSPGLLCFLRGHVPDRLRTFVHGRTTTTCTRCGVKVQRGRNMQWDSLR